ncbi:MAG TPA: hypothetical protein VFP22_06500 [Candidatus Limnocylindrales bacterium]|nr:hypothetical protein [Candidatus Limnocylindrales bacterium]
MIDQLNILVQPPTVPDSANLVQRVEALIPFRRAVWPLFFAENGALAIAFVLLAGLAMFLGANAGESDSRRRLLVWTLGMAGILGAIAQVVLLGAVKATVDIPYCDCGFKNEEIVSQVWAQMVAGSSVQMLIDAASILAAAGVVVAGVVFGRGRMPTSWVSLSYLTGALLLLTVVLDWTAIGGDAASWFTAIVVGVVVPIWVLWLGAKAQGRPIVA